MWLTLLVMVLSYLMQDPQNGKERKNALMRSMALGAVTYGVTEYTDWGQENLAPINDSISDFIGIGEPDTTVTAESGATGGAVGVQAGVAGGAGVASVLSSIGPGTAALGGFLAGASSPGWVPLALAAGAAVLLIK